MNDLVPFVWVYMRTNTSWHLFTNILVWQRCILLPIAKDQDPRNRAKVHRKWFFWIFTTVCLLPAEWICFVFHKSSWWPVWAFFVGTTLTIKIKLGKEYIRKYFVALQKFSKIFHDPSIYPKICFMTLA